MNPSNIPDRIYSEDSIHVSFTLINQHSPTLKSVLFMLLHPYFYPFLVTFHIFDRCRKALPHLSKSFSTYMEKLYDYCQTIKKSRILGSYFLLFQGGYYDYLFIFTQAVQQIKPALFAGFVFYLFVLELFDIDVFLNIF